LLHGTIRNADRLAMQCRDDRRRHVSPRRRQMRVGGHARWQRHQPLRERIGRLSNWSRFVRLFLCSGEARRTRGRGRFAGGALCLCQLATHQRWRRSQVKQRVFRLRGFGPLDQRAGPIQVARRNGRSSFDEQLIHVAVRQSSGLGGIRGNQADRQPKGAGSQTQGWHPFRVQLATPFGDVSRSRLDPRRETRAADRLDDTTRTSLSGTPLANSCWLESDGPC
jgi:hypothetical protein